MMLGSYRKGNKLIQRSAQAAEHAGYSAFGVQYAQQCWSGPLAHMTYNKYGNSSGCVNGTGGVWVQDIYMLVSRCCFRDIAFSNMCVVCHLKPCKQRARWYTDPTKTE